MLDKEKPAVIRNEDTGAANIIEECGKEPWIASEGAIGEDAKMVIDVKCPLKLQEVQLINGVGDFSTKSFSVFGSQDSTGPWSRLYKGELKEGRVEVIYGIVCL